MFWLSPIVTVEYWTLVVVGMTVSGHYADTLPITTGLIAFLDQ